MSLFGTMASISSRLSLGTTTSRDCAGVTTPPTVWIASCCTTPSTGAVKDRKSTRLNSSHLGISYAVFCLKKKNETATNDESQQLRSALDLTKMSEYTNHAVGVSTSQ